MPRGFSTTIRAALEGPRTSEAPLIFLTIEHAALDAAIRIVSDVATTNGVPVTYTHRGASFTAMPFDVELLSDDDGAPKGKISVQNVDRAIGEAILALQTRVTLTIEIVPASEFNLTVSPRVPLVGNHAIPIYRAIGLTLRDVSVDAMGATGEIVSLEDDIEPWPYLRVTQALLPGLYRR